MSRQNLVIGLLFVLWAGLAAWLQAGLPHGKSDAGTVTVTVTGNAPDYIITGFTSTVVGRDRQQYRLAADRLAHYPDDRRALLTRPHIMQYADATAVATRRITADSGYLYRRDEVLLSGNVRVVENPGGDESIAVVDSMRIKLRGDDG